MPEIAIHYHRIDGDYDEVGLWTWDWDGRRNPVHQEVFPVGHDAFGSTFHLATSSYGEGTGAPSIGLLPRRERRWSLKDDPERRWLPAHGNEIWIVQGDGHIYTAPPDISPRVRLAFLDAPATVMVWFTERTPHELPAGIRHGVRIEGPAGELILLHKVHEIHDRHAVLEFERAVPFEGQRWEIHVPGVRPGVLRPRGVLFDVARFNSHEPMGAFVADAHTDFRVFAPEATSVSVSIQRAEQVLGGPREEPLGHAGHGVWTGRVAGNHEGRNYMLRVTHPFLPAPVDVADICATNATGRERAPRLTNLRRTDPPGFRPVYRPEFSGHLTDAIITELSVRDFSAASSSGTAHPGKFLAFTERGTHVPNHPNASTCLDHLRELGVTHVQLLPIQDFDNFEDRPDYNWGYMTTHFNSPDGWYATRQDDDSRIRECKRMIQALHEAGLRVVMDVVYNHVATGAGFDLIAPGYYLRLRNDGRKWDGSGCGNEFRSEAPMARRFIIDSLKFWVEEYGVDGFRFDLMGLIDRETMLAARDELRAIEPTLLLYGEPWVAAPTMLHNITDKWAIRGTHIGAFNDNFRNALKGEPDGSATGYVQGAWTRDAVARGIEGSINDWTLDPGDTVNYADCHDNLTLWDKLASSTPNESEGERIKMHNLVAAILAVSQGAMFLHGGHELARTKSGHGNSYDAGDAINALDWTRKTRYRGVFDYTRGLIALRRAHPLFRLRTSVEVRERIRFFFPLPKSHQVIAFTIDGAGLPGEVWAAALVLINPYHRPRTIPIPEGHWRVHALGPDARLEPFATADARLTVPGRTLALLAR